MDPLLIGAIGAVLGLLSAVAVVMFWKQILNWAEESLFPWIKTNIPSIESAVREAFSVLDDKVVTARNIIIGKGWKKLREYLLKQVITFQRQSSGEWVRQATSWVIKNLESGDKVPARVTVEEEIDWDVLPPDVRAEWLKRQKNEAQINLTEYRDREIMEMYA
ncbi:MAG: hypothetical protein MGF17_13940 [Trichodesmium sp. MAG_R04]|nr:hypothetical protein [Trichodesmium sp. MAG_R04]